MMDKQIKLIEEQTGVKVSRSAYLSALVRLNDQKDDEICVEAGETRILFTKQTGEES